MITEDYVSFETAKLLKEKGFDERTNSYFTDNNEIAVSWFFSRYNRESTYLSAPTLQMAMKWLRFRNWVICVIPMSFCLGLVTTSWGYNIWADDNLEIDEENTPKFKTYEEACEAGIKYCLENLI